MSVASISDDASINNTLIEQRVSVVVLGITKLTDDAEGVNVKFAGALGVAVLMAHCS